MEDKNIKEVSDLTFSTCPTCGIRFVNTETPEGVVQQFWWSRGNTPATADQVYSKVCGLVSGEKAEKCVNKTGQHVQGLGWGESVEEQLLSRKIDELFGES